jgi:hypothetical protein
VSGNHATDGGGGGLTSLGSLTMVSCTVSGNDSFDSFGFDGGGGVLLDFTATMTIDNTILAGNTSNVPFEANIGGFGYVVHLGTNLVSGDPGLDVLGDYGGSTFTMPPQAGSKAAGTGVPTASTPETDQRGFPRIDGALDIGAVETGFIGSTTSPYDGWAANNIAIGEDPSFTGDSEGDGAKNGLEYAFRMNPQAFDSILQPRGYPVPDGGTGGGTRDLQITIPFRATATDIRYLLLESSDLLTFSEIYRYDVLTDTGTVTGPNLLIAIDYDNQTITITDPILHPQSTYWKVGVEQTE